MKLTEYAVGAGASWRWSLGYDQESMCSCPQLLPPHSPSPFLPCAPLLFSLPPTTGANCHAASVLEPAMD